MLWHRMRSIKLLNKNEAEIKKRLHKTLIKYAIVLWIALAYLLFVLCTGIGIPCVFHEITGLKCPGCGISRMLIALIKLDFAAAFKHNPVLFLTAPFLVAYLFGSEWKYVLYGHRHMGKWQIFLWAELCLLLLYGIFRNIFPI